MTKEDSIYLKKICKDYNILPSYAHTKKHQSGKTYKEIYEQTKEDEQIVLKAQEVLTDKTGKDIYQCSCFTAKTKLQTAYNFINDLYGTDTSKPIHKGIVKRCKAILEFLGETNEKSRIN